MSVESGKLVFMDASGIRRSWTNAERKSLQMEYGIEYKDGRGLSTDFVDGYNHEMSIEATKRFGVDYRSRLVFKAHPELGLPRTSPK